MIDCMKRNILIVCYSYSGKTRKIAEMIQKQTGGRLNRIYPRQPYPADFERHLVQVKEEIRTGEKPSLLPVNENADSYDIIFAGSPNWCGTIAPPLASWLNENDLTGKLLLPFFSHCGGAEKELEQAIRDLCPTASVGNSLYVLGDGGRNLQNIIQTWLKQEIRQSKKKS